MIYKLFEPKLFPKITTPDCERRTTPPVMHSSSERSCQRRRPSHWTAVPSSRVSFDNRLALMPSSGWTTSSYLPAHSVFCAKRYLNARPSADSSCSSKGAGSNPAHVEERPALLCPVLGDTGQVLLLGDRVVHDLELSARHHRLVVLENGADVRDEDLGALDDIPGAAPPDVSR